MLMAYIDEVGEAGAFVSREHPRFNTSPGFGYAGFVIPMDAARRFGMWFAEEKRKLFATEIAASANPAQWERKGASIFRSSTLRNYPQQLRVFSGLVRRLRSVGGNLFYYVDEKPIGTPKQTSLDTDDRELRAIKETLNRLARHADGQGNSLLVLMDQVNEKQRLSRIPSMYAHIFSRAGTYAEMHRLVEPPMHLDSSVSANVQFADWIAACVGRAVDYQLIESSEHAWITTDAVSAVRGSFTHESKLHLHNRALNDINHSALYSRDRPLYPMVQGQRISAAMPVDALRKLRAAAERNHKH
jgi:hypothetical protein